MILHPILISTRVVDYSFGLCNRESYDLPWELSDIVEDTWYSISPPSATSGGLKDVTHDGFGKLTIGKSGEYRVSWILNLPGEGGLDYGQFGGARLEDCVESAVKINGEIISQYDDRIDLNELINNSCTVEIGAGEVVDINIRAITLGISTIIMDVMHLEVIEIGTELQHHFPSTYI